jgi:hypothetical protein
MRGWQAGALVALSVIFLVQKVRADIWRPVVRPAPVVTSEILDTAANPIVTLGRPEGMNRSAAVSENPQRTPAGSIIPVSYESTTRTLASPIIRGQIPEQTSPTLAPPTGGFPATPEAL